MILTLFALDTGIKSGHQAYALEKGKPVFIVLHETGVVLGKEIGEG